MPYQVRIKLTFVLLMKNNLPDIDMHTCDEVVKFMHKAVNF